MRKARFEIEEDIRRWQLEPLNPKVVVEYVNGLKKFLESSNIFERRAFLGTFIESMEVDDGEITFNSCLPPDGAKQETISVLGTIPSGPPLAFFFRFLYNAVKRISSLEMPERVQA